MRSHLVLDGASRDNFVMLDAHKIPQSRCQSTGAPAKGGLLSHLECLTRVEQSRAVDGQADAGVDFLRRRLRGDKSCAGT